MIILNNAGLSPLTVGMTGLEGIDASAESQQEREKVSIRTRNKKIELWTETLDEFMQTALEFYIIVKDLQPNKSMQFSAGTIPEFTINTIFEDYIIKSSADRTREASEGITGLTWDIATSVNYVHKDKTEREKLAMIANIKLENDITSFTPSEASALQSIELDKQELLKEEGVEIIELAPEIEEEPEVEIEEVEE